VRVDEWAEAYARAWEEADDDAVGALFTVNATYRSSPFQEPYRGRDAIEAYWREVTSSQSKVFVAMGAPVVCGRRAVVEWWTQMDNDGTPVTLPGALILDFDEAGLCEGLREYWNLEVGLRIPPYDGWGS
jgi:SnoaL-like domain